jgi:hypothetical protein
MLRRVNAGLYEEEDGADIQLVVKATNNSGVEAAQFDYDSTVLHEETIQGFPGARFTVKPGIRQFRVLVVFSPTAPATARYDLFQVNAAGTLTAVGKSVTNSGGTPLIGFGIDGIPVEAAVGVGEGRRKRPKPARRTRHKTMLTRRRAATPTKPPRAKRTAKRESPTRKTKTPGTRSRKRRRAANKKP